MSYKRLQQLLMLLAVFLVCSITPAAAIQNISTQSSTGSYIDLFNKTYIEDTTKLLNSFDEASNTELTPEQDQYLEQRESVLLSKAEKILYNLQQFLNILLTGYYEGNADNEGQENPLQRKLLENKESNKSSKTEDKFTKDANEMASYLNNEKKLKKKDKQVRNQSCTYEELEVLVQDKVYDKDNVIVQVRDRKYVRYMKLVDINAANIHLKSGEREIDTTSEKFKTNSMPNLPDHRFNVLIVPENQNTDDLLGIIWEKQRNDIKWSISFLNTGKIVCVTLVGVGGVSVVAAGAYKVGDYCNSHTRQIITEQIINNGDPEEGAALIKPDQLTKTYTRITQEVSNDQLCNKKTTAISIIICGTLILVGSVIGHILCSKYEQDCIDDKGNLEGYEPT